MTSSPCTQRNTMHARPHVSATTPPAIGAPPPSGVDRHGHPFEGIAVQQANAPIVDHRWPRRVGADVPPVSTRAPDHHQRNDIMHETQHTQAEHEALCSANLGHRNISRHGNISMCEAALWSSTALTALSLKLTWDFLGDSSVELDFFNWCIVLAHPVLVSVAFAYVARFLVYDMSFASTVSSCGERKKIENRSPVHALASLPSPAFGHRRAPQASVFPSLNDQQ